MAALDQPSIARRRRAGFHHHAGAARAAVEIPGAAGAAQNGAEIAQATAHPQIDADAA